MIKSAALTFCCLVALLSVVNADTPLEKSMQRLAKATKQLNLDLKAPVDTSKADYLALTAAMKTEVQKARDLVPIKAAALPADQQATMVAAFQKSMNDLGTTIDAMSQAIQDGKWDDARKLMDQVHKQEGDGHQEFRNHDKKGPAPATPAPATPAPDANAAPAQPTPPPTTPPAPAPGQ